MQSQVKREMGGVRKRVQDTRERIKLQTASIKVLKKDEREREMRRKR